MVRAEQEHPGLTGSSWTRCGDRGPITAVELEEAIAHDMPRDRTEWGWNWSVVKRLLELMFWAGEVTLVRAQQPVRPALRPAGAGAARRRAGGADPGRRRGAPAAGVHLGAGFRRGHRVLAARPLPARPGAARAGGRRAGGRRELLPVTVEGWKRPAYLHARARRAAPGPGPRPGQPVRLAGLGAGPRARPVRLRLPHRDLRAGAEAAVRLLRAAVPARRHPGRPGRPEGGPAGGRRRRRAAGPGGWARAGRAAADVGRAGGTSCSRWPAGSGSGPWG